MSNLNIKYFVSILIALSAMVWLIIATFKNIDLRQATALFGELPLVVAVDLFCITLFVKWLWKWKWLHGWLVPFPNLNGTWTGEIQLNLVNPETGAKILPTQATLGIKQSFFKISCVVRTEEMRSDSYTEGFRIDFDRQIKQLIYTYSSKPWSSENNKSTSYDGSVVLDVVENPVRRLKGRYWTERETTGVMNFVFKKKEILDLLPSEIE